MRWLLHGEMTAAVGEALRRRGDTASTAPELGFDLTDAPEILKLAREKQLDVITSSPELADAVFSGGCPFARSIVYLQLSGGDVEQDDAIDRLFARYKRLAPGRLYTVTATRVKIRQLPST